MGYTTEFTGAFFFDFKVKPEQRDYINKFSETRRMVRNITLAKRMADPLREAVGLPIGKQGEYFVGGLGFAGQDEDPSVKEYNCPPATQPGLWCKWVVSEDCTRLEWNGMEKFYDYHEWLEYMIGHFFEKWGYTLSGKVDWQGEDPSDTGTIFVEDNQIITTGRNQTSYD